MRLARTFTRSTPRGISDKINDYATKHNLEIISFNTMPVQTEEGIMYVGCVIYEDHMERVAKHESGV